MSSLPPQPTDVIHTLARRWYLAVVGLILGVGVVAATLIVARVTYTAQADVLLYPPKAPNSANPLLDLGGLEDVPVTIARSVFTDAAVAELAKQGITSGYNVTTDFTTSAPLLLASGSGNTPAQALAAMNAVSKLIPATLTRLQIAQGVIPSARITVSVIHADTTATPVTRTRTRLLFVAALIAVLLTAGLPIAADRLMTRRATRRRRLAAGPPTPKPAKTPAPAPGHRVRLGDSVPSAPSPRHTVGRHVPRPSSSTSAPDDVLRH